MFKELFKRYNYLIWTIGIGEVFVSFNTIVDMLAVSILGVSSLAGYTLASGFIGTLYLCYDAINTFAYAEYANKKDTKILNIASKLGFVAQVITILLIISIMIVLLQISGLSPKANQIALITIVGRSIGSLFFNMTTPYYVYYRSEGKENIATFSRIAASFVNMGLDVLAIVFKLGITGVIAATIISEIFEYSFLKIYSLYKKVRFNKVSYREAFSHIRHMLQGYGVQLSIQVNIIGVAMVASRLGDESYAIYGIIQTINNQLLWFVYSNDMIVGILYGEFKSRYDKAKQLFYDTLKVVIKPMILYSLIASSIAPLLLKILTYDNKLEISLGYLLFVTIFWIVVETYTSILNGYVYILSKYNTKIFAELVSAVLGISVTYFCTYTNNVYITYFVGWVLSYIVMFYCEYRVIVKNL